MAEPAGTALVVLATLNHPDREGDLILPGALANDRPFSPAVRLYGRLGFSVVGRVPDVIDGEAVLIFWRSLKDDAG